MIPTAFRENCGGGFLPADLLLFIWGDAETEKDFSFTTGLLGWGDFFPGFGKEFFWWQKKITQHPSKREVYTSSMVMLLCFLVVMLVFFSIFFVREILHTSHVKSHIGSNRQKDNQHGVPPFFKKNVTNVSHNNMGFPPKLSKQLRFNLSFFVFPDLPSSPRNFLPSSYGRWSQPRGVERREREVIGGHSGQVGSLRIFASKLVSADWDGKNVSKYCYLYR